MYADEKSNLGLPSWSISFLTALVVGGCSSPDPAIGDTETGTPDMGQTEDSGQTEDAADEADLGARDVGGDASLDAGGDADAGAQDAGFDAGTETVTTIACRITTDAPNDGAPDMVVRQYVDDEDNLIRREDDTDADGTANNVITWEILAGESIERQDNGDDGVIDVIIHRFFDDQERLIREERDFDADGVAEETSTWEFVGNTETFLYDGDGDGTPEYRYVWVRNDQGEILRAEEDSGNDGSIETLSVYTYDASGQLTGRTDDFGDDGVIDATATYEYDAQGRPVRYAVDTDGDGLANSVDTTIWSDDGRVYRTESDQDADGTPERIFQRTLDAEGRLVEMWADSDADGIPQWLRTWEYDEYGRIVRYTEDRMGDGSVERVETSEYECL